MPSDPAARPAPSLLQLIDSQILVDRSAAHMGYPQTRSLRELREFLAGVGFPRTFEERLRLSLIPYFQFEARGAGLDWTDQAAALGALTPIFEIDAMTMNEGRGRDAMSPEEFARYVGECHALLDEFTAIRARMHNGEE